ncbi:hypothetical protein GCM10009654_11980 [Streptomyces hebeiensis]|uniref:Type II toxin-antitoxin system RelE/ParE family toxin n=1 Tax=Streptomyces hebeiensis TaxID=229486 RepID=A0ABN1UN43_9ACTN
MKYRIAYAPAAEQALGKLAGPDAFRAAVARTIGAQPYGHGSTQVDGDRDRREAVVSGAIIRYVVSAGILTVTVVRLVPAP